MNDRYNAVFKSSELWQGSTIDDSLALQFRDVSLNYRDFQSSSEGESQEQKNEAFVKSLNFELKRGEKMCVLGSSGSGKSTIFKALNGYFNNFSGAIQI